ncbi:MAG: hypothetical protein GC179_12725 [Anaerolineaceae bacterium]|nr:hypothetical protein [Anaerolineaceae bacterium]
MNKSRLILTLMFLLSVTGHIVTAQNDSPAHDLMVIGIDPKTLDGGKNSDIYLVRSDGSRTVNLTDTPLDSENKAYWSADGQQIYFSRNSVARYAGSTEEQSSTSFYVMDISDTGEKTAERLLFHLSDIIGKPMRVEDWALSPDGQLLAFIPEDEEAGGTYVVNIDGTNLNERFKKGVVSTSVWLQWSPDSREFAYKTNECLDLRLDTPCPYWVAQSHGEQAPHEVGTLSELMARWHQSGEVYVVNNGGTFEIHDGIESLWSVDGQIPDLSLDKHQMAFADFESSASKGILKVSDLKAEHVVKIAEMEDQLFHVHWSPDGAQIAFAVYKGSFNDFEIYVVNPDGSEQKMLIRRQTWSREPLAWRPEPQTKVG